MGVSYVFLNAYPILSQSVRRRTLVRGRKGLCYEWLSLRVALSRIPGKTSLSRAGLSTSTVGGLLLQPSSLFVCSCCV